MEKKSLKTCEPSTVSFRCKMCLFALVLVSCCLVGLSLTGCATTPSREKLEANHYEIIGREFISYIEPAKYSFEIDTETENIANLNDSAIAKWSGRVSCLVKLERLALLNLTYGQLSADGLPSSERITIKGQDLFQVGRESLGKGKESYQGTIDATVENKSYPVLIRLSIQRDEDMAQIRFLGVSRVFSLLSLSDDILADAYVAKKPISLLNGNQIVGTISEKDVSSITGIIANLILQKGNETGASFLMKIKAHEHLATKYEDQGDFSKAADLYEQAGQTERAKNLRLAMAAIKSYKFFGPDKLRDFYQKLSNPYAFKVDEAYHVKGLQIRDWAGRDMAHALLSDSTLSLLNLGASNYFFVDPGETDLALLTTSNPDPSKLMGVSQAEGTRQIQKMLANQGLSCILVPIGVFGGEPKFRIVHLFPPR
jgi:hypothetical protein